jgi:hypothetical protein
MRGRGHGRRGQADRIEDGIEDEGCVGEEEMDGNTKLTAGVMAKRGVEGGEGREGNMDGRMGVRVHGGGEGDAEDGKRDTHGAHGCRRHRIPPNPHAIAGHGDDDVASARST